MKTIYSDYMETMIPAGFTIRKVFFDIQGNEPYKVSKHSEHYTWDEVNLLYMSDEVDDEAYMAIPNNGVTWVTLKEGKRARALVVLD